MPDRYVGSTTNASAPAESFFAITNSDAIAGLGLQKAEQ